MIFKYVLKNFTRRKVRTILMILALMVSTGLIVTMIATVETVRQSNIDLIASSVGRFDMSITRPETSLLPFIDIDDTSAAMLEADERITAVYPRFQAPVELQAAERVGEGFLLALDPETDIVGTIDVREGDYVLGDLQAALLEDTAHKYDLQVGDSIDVSFSFPRIREIGRSEAPGTSERRSTKRFTIVAIVRQDGVANEGIRDGLIVDLADVQDWLGLPGQAGTLIATVEPSLYDTNNTDVATLRMRDVVRAVQEQLGDEYLYHMDKARELSNVAQVFLFVQAIINTYGFISLGIVGLLVYTLVMTNVQEQRRDMAILRILGSRRSYLFLLVIAEVFVIGLIGIGLGVLLGQALTQFAVVPIIQSQMANAGISLPLVPNVSISALWPVVTAAFVVLLIASLRPAREASRTKVVYAINPSVADNIQIEDLDQLRERRPDFKLFLLGLSLMLIFGLIASVESLAAFGGPAVEVMIIVLAIGLLVLGLGLMFFITTVPFEKLVLLVLGFIMPRLTYFARRNVSRGQSRNTLISMLVLFSAVLPSFLATQVAMENANFEANIRQYMGAPVAIEVPSWLPEEEADSVRLKPSFRTQTLATVEGIDQTAARTYGYQTEVADPVGFRTAPLTVYGVDGYLNELLYPDLVTFTAGGSGALDRLLDESDAIVISEGLANHLAVALGERIKVTGEGIDHDASFRIIGIARAIPTLSGFSRSRTAAQGNSDALVSMAAFDALQTELNQPLPPADRPVLERIFLNLTADIPATDVAGEFGRRFSQDYGFWWSFIDIAIEDQREEQAMMQVLLLALTTISFTTAVFGVFAVIYVSIAARQLEVGMLKAIGMKRRELTGMLVLESITLTLGPALAGIAAGAFMGYIIFYGERILTARPSSFAIDSTVIPFIVFMVVLASIVGATLSSQRLVRKKAVDLLKL